MRNVIVLLAAILTITATSCNKDDAAKAKFSVKEKSLKTKSVQNGTFTFTKAMIGISEIDFEIEIGSTEREVEFEGAYQFDVLTGASSPVISPVEIEPGAYHELEIEVENVLASGNSIEISGVYDEGAIEYQFEFTSKLEEDYDIIDSDGIPASSGETIQFVLYLDLEALFTGIDFSTATVDNDNIIRINSASNSSLASIIEDNFDDIMELDED